MGDYYEATNELGDGSWVVIYDHPAGEVQVQCTFDHCEDDETAEMFAKETADLLNKGDSLETLWVYKERGKIVSVHRHESQCPEPDYGDEVREVQHWTWDNTKKQYTDTGCRGHDA